VAMSAPEPADLANLDILTITKLEAARRQLRTAITLWFSDDDPISIHTLACAAYEIIHTLTKKTNPLRPNLLFDGLAGTDEERKALLLQLKKPANFFKHADRDVDETLPFTPLLTEIFIIGSIAGIYTHDGSVTVTSVESAFVVWFFIHPPGALSEQTHKLLTGALTDALTKFPPESIELLRSIGKKEFLRIFQTSTESVSQN
jgi:hypothetical protein